MGGGPSGCAAATAAAREGAKTLLMEGTGALGGMGTSGKKLVFRSTNLYYELTKDALRKKEKETMKKHD